MASALMDKNSGQPVHFDCVITRIEEHEFLEKGEVVAYLGGGRFGVVRFNHTQNSRNFSVKKILEWEDKENRAEWRKTIADHYSIT
jgi:MoaA/NifB/PqqE/SkfB family radical SAM enzyme